jgi:GTP cyclohydrolase I
MIDQHRVEVLIAELLDQLGQPHREGLHDTPARVARFWKEFLEYDPGNIDVTFESTSIDQMIVVTGIRVYSLCEHHLLPITCDVSIAYLSGPRVLGLSKLARIAHKHAHKLQLQERMTQEIADEVSATADVPDVAVLVEGVHMCMVMRGIKTLGKMITSEMRGRFRDPGRARIEFLQLVKGG